MTIKIDQLSVAEMPKRTHSFWRMAGPGAVLVGLSIGAGEIVIWPRIMAQYGATMAWAAMLGVFLQLWINLEIGRWTISTGETPFTGFARIWRGFAPVFLILTMLGWLVPGWARASGLALKALMVGPGGYGSDTFWTVITFAAAAVILFGPKIVYQSVERSVEFLVVIVTVGLISLVIAVSSVAVWQDLGLGIVSIGKTHPDISVKTLFSALVFAGAGGTANLFYSFYLRDKNIGMGARIPRMTNPLRGRSEAAPSSGFRFKETEENISRFSAWWSYVKKDQIIFFWFLNTFTIVLFMFGALAVLTPRGIVPAAGTLIWDEAVVLGEVWGESGKIIFLLVGVATLFGTQLVLLDGVSRTFADIIYTNVRSAQKREVSWWYLTVCLGWIVAGCVITYVMENRGVTDLGFLFNAGYMGGFAMAIYVPLTLYMNYRYLPKSVRPGVFSTIMMIIASAVYIGFAISSIRWEISAWIG
ncbi:MAG: Nramp family divalent metal transporter [Candidatus Marinimicrobia bacterium]|nr:Nramp family divalent metal transporter [Candidatus Neomarinimicrobiota bacterium]